MASEAVLKYLTDTNRPYSCADVTVNLRGAFPKSAIQKALDALSDSNKIKCKLYGKQKVYVAIQQQIADEDSDVEDIDARLKEIAQSLTEKRSVLKKVELDLKVLTSAPTTSDAKAQIADKNNNVDKISEKINNLKASTNIVSVEERKSTLEQHENRLKMYRTRKRICSDMIESMLEGYPKPKKVFLEELCIETDDMVNFKLLSNTM